MGAGDYGCWRRVASDRYSMAVWWTYHATAATTASMLLGKFRNCGILRIWLVSGEAVLSRISLPGLTHGGCGSPAWIRTTIHGSKGRCPTIRRPGKCAGKRLPD